MTRAAPAAWLGIADLPGDTGALCAGGMYALEVESVSTRFDLIIQSLHANIAAGLQCALLTPIPPEEWLARLRDNRDTGLLADLQSGKWLLLVMQGDYGKNIFRFGAEGFIAELDRSGLADGCALLIDRADSLFSLHDPMLAARQAGIYGQWCRTHHASALMFFLSRPETTSTTTFRAMLDYFSGHARLQVAGTDDSLRLELDHWRSVASTIAGLRLRLRTGPDGILRALAQPPEVTPALVESTAPAAVRDEDDLISMDEALIAARPSQAPGQWRHARSFAGLLELARAAHSATVVLDFVSGGTLGELAEKVYALRQAMNGRAKVVVREHGASLRFSGTALLFQLGVNAVISSTTSAARLDLLIRSLRGQTSQQHLDLPIDDAIASASPPDLQGVVDAHTFARHVRDALMRARTLALPCLLVTFLAAPGASPTQLAARLRLGRRGDIATADEARVALFLFACAAEDLTPALERIAADCADVCSAIDLILSEPEHMEWFLANELSSEAQRSAALRESVPMTSAYGTADTADSAVPPQAALAVEGLALRKLVGGQVGVASSLADQGKTRA